MKLMKGRIIQAVKIWFVIYPSITVFYLIFGKHLINIPMPLRTLILTLILVPWMMFVGIPGLNILIEKFQKSEKP